MNDCEGCKYWSELCGESIGCGPWVALCLNSESPLSQQMVRDGCDEREYGRAIDTLWGCP